MVGETRPRTYQIFQGQMGNFTRFINHSCKPNSQFQRFHCSSRGGSRREVRLRWIIRIVIGGSWIRDVCVGSIFVGLVGISSSNV